VTVIISTEEVFDGSAPGCIISADGKIGSGPVVFGTQAVSHGQASWQISLRARSPSGIAACGLAIGLADAELDAGLWAAGYTEEASCCRVQRQFPERVFVLLGDGRCPNATFGSADRGFGADDIITVTLDSDRGELKFLVQRLKRSSRLSTKGQTKGDSEQVGFRSESLRCRPMRLWVQPGEYGECCLESFERS
jgi:hypothetical protein